MFSKNKLFAAGIAGVALVFALVFFSCDDLGYKAQATDSAIRAETPVILTQPVGDEYEIGEANAKLSVVVAEVKDGGALTYQWYTANDEKYDADAGDAIAGANGAEYTLDRELGEGVYQIYVVVTNTLTVKKGVKTATAKSDLVRVVLNDPNNAPYPYITADPRGTAYEWTTGTTTTITPDEISVTVRDPKNGTLSYQWYSATAYTSTGGTIIASATTKTYQPPAITEAGVTRYYYVVVTNTWAEAPARTVSVTESSPAVIKTVVINATITVNSTKAQYVRGFGVMAPFWGNAPQDTMKDYETMYNPNGPLGYNILRIMIPVDGANIKTTMKKALNNELSGDKDRKHYYDMVKVVNKYGGFVLASPWSPPPAWKSNKAKAGGGAGADAVLLKEYWPDYADYLKEYCKIMYDNGAPIFAVSIQNEPNYRADYDGCEWTGAEMRDFFKQVGIFTEGVKGFGGGVETERVLTMNGESANSPSINSQALADPDAYKNIDLFARHIYGNAQESISSQVQALGKEVWMTEYNVNSGGAATYPNDSTYPYMWKFFNTVDLVIRLNKENAFVWWYGRRFYSQIGDGDYQTVSGTILPRGYALAHFGKFASNTDQVGLTVSGVNGAGGAITVGSNFNNSTYDLDNTAVRALAFLSKDGNSLSLVLATPTLVSGLSGTNMGNVKIAFPANFAATKVTAMRTSQGAMGATDVDTVLLQGGTGAVVNLPAGQILSVKFTK